MGNVNSKWINIVFCIDESGSMWGSRDEVTSGFKKMIDEQKEVKDGKVTVSLFTFNSDVKTCFVGKDINDIGEFEYNPSSMTRMNDGIGTAIDSVGKWLYERDKNNEEMPQKTMFVLFTDGMENSSQEYTLKQVQDKIKEQTEKYSWEFVYQGVDITTSKAADELGFKYKTYGSREDFSNNYNIVNKTLTAWRASSLAGASVDEANAVFCSTLNEEAMENTSRYEKKLGKKISKV